jgi:hypothetical protein
MDYKVVFDVTQMGYKSWSPPLLGLILLVVGTLLVRYRNRLPVQASSDFVRRFFFIMLGLASLLLLAAFGGTFWEYRSLCSAVRQGRVSVVEGEVSQFRPESHTVKAPERFCVRDTCFEYSEYGMTPGFNHTSSRGGPIREGLRVRVTHVRGTIVRLEVATE